jgi:hypothetical protein
VIDCGLKKKQKKPQSREFQKRNVKRGKMSSRRKLTKNMKKPKPSQNEEALVCLFMDLASLKAKQWCGSLAKAPLTRY